MQKSKNRKKICKNFSFLTKYNTPNEEIIIKGGIVIIERIGLGVSKVSDAGMKPTIIQDATTVLENDFIFERA